MINHDEFILIAILNDEIEKLHGSKQPHFQYDNFLKVYDGNAEPIMSAMKRYAEQYSHEYYILKYTNLE